MTKGIRERLGRGDVILEAQADDHKAQRYAWWDTEAQLHINEFGMDLATARTVVIVRWMLHGNFKPLIAAIHAGHNLDKVVLHMLASMLEGSELFSVHLQPVSRGRGRVRAMRPENTIRDFAIAQVYEATDGNSDEVFAALSKVVGTSEKTVRQAVTARRKKQES